MIPAFVEDARNNAGRNTAHFFLSIWCFVENENRYSTGHHAFNCSFERWGASVVMKETERKPGGKVLYACSAISISMRALQPRFLCVGHNTAEFSMDGYQWSFERNLQFSCVNLIRLEFEVEKGRTTGAHSCISYVFSGEKNNSPHGIVAFNL